MKYNKFVAQPAPRFEDETELQTARQALREFVDHPASISLGRKEGMGDNALVFIPRGMPDGPMVIIDECLLEVQYLGWEARHVLSLCLAQGPMFSFSGPLAKRNDYHNWCDNTLRKILTELRIAGHAIKVQVYDGSMDTKPVVIWKFSERPCGLPAAELQNAVFKTTMPQFAIHGIKALPKGTPRNRSGGFRLGYEVARLDGIPPKYPGWE